MDTIVYRDPFDHDRIATMPVEMVGAYVPYASELSLEDAARIADIRDAESAVNLLLSVIDPNPEELDETTAQQLTAAQ
jgi:hypothetical protein